MRIAVLIFLFLISLPVQAVPISVAWVSDLNFGVGVALDPARIIPPGTSENSSNGSFRVSGDASAAFTISLPGSVTMNHSTASGPNGRIAVTSFISNPGAGANGRLSAAGSATVFLGATRAALRAAQAAGSYSGTYTITVIY